MKKLKRILSAVLAVMMTLSCAAFIGAANISFTDVSGHWAWTNGQIPYLVDKGVLNGYKNASNGTYSFKPDGEVTRAEFIKMLDETFGLTKTEKISYADIKESDWFYTYFAKASAQGYILNYGSKVSPNGKISRQEATALLVRYLDLPADEKADSSVIADYGDISVYYNDYVLRAVKAGIINGYNENGKTYFKPKKTLSRAEALTILYKAAGCIYSSSVYSRDNSAYKENNSVTKSGITITKVTFEDGRNIVTEGASDGKITFSNCTLNGTLYIRGGADIIFDSCTIDTIVAMGGGKLTFSGKTKADTVIVEKTCTLGVNAKVSTVEIAKGADNVIINGDGSIEKLYISADGCQSSIVPSEFDIAGGYSAYFKGEEYTGDSSAQNAFSVEPFVTADESYYYINLIAEESGTMYYYYTNSLTTPSASSFNSYYMSASFSGSFDIRANMGAQQKTFTPSQVQNYSYIVLQLRDGSRLFPPVLIQNIAAGTETGFKVEPYLYDSTTVRYQSGIVGRILWFYAEDGKKLDQLSFLEEYAAQSSALKGDEPVTSIREFSVSLKAAYLESYDFMAFMLYDTQSGTYNTPVVVSLGDNGFNTVPEVKTAGIITYEPSVNGKLYYYYSKNANLPTPAKFKSEYNSAESRYSGTVSVKKGSADEMRYNTSYVSDYPYLIVAIKNSSTDEFMQPVAVDINLTTGFEVDPKVKSTTTIQFRALEDGTVYYYYTKDKSAPTIKQFTDNYENIANTKYRGYKECGTMYDTIEYSTTYAQSYGYMAIMFVNEDGKKFSPVLVQLDATQKTGFKVAPYAEDGKIYFSTEKSGAVYYFYSYDDDPGDPDDFYYYYRKADYFDNIETASDTLQSFEYDEKTLRRNPYIVFAFLDSDAVGDKKFNYFYYPYVLDVEESERTRAGSGLTVSNPDKDGEFTVKSKYNGRLYFFWTNAKDELPGDYRSFSSAYRNAAKFDDKRIYKDDNITLDLKGYKYMALALEVDGNYMSYVIVSAAGKVDGDSDDDSGIKYDESSYGIKDVLYLKNKIFFTPEYSGKVTLFLPGGFLTNTGYTEFKSTTCSADKENYIELPEYLTSDSPVGGMLYGMTVYLQLTDSEGRTHAPVSLKLISK